MGGWLDDVVDMMVEMLTMTIVHNPEVLNYSQQEHLSHLNSVGWRYDGGFSLSIDISSGGASIAGHTFGVAAPTSGTRISIRSLADEFDPNFWTHQSVFVEHPKVRV